MSPIYTGDKLGFGVAPSSGSGGGAAVEPYNNAGMVFTNAGAYGNAGPGVTQISNEYKDQKFYTGNHYFHYTGGTYEGILFVRAPKSGSYHFEIRGAFGGPSDNFNGGTNKGGSPWYMMGDVDLVGGRWIGVVVGQRGGEAGKSYTSSTGGGGGGGTFLFELDGSESEEALTKSYVESASVTCLLVAAGGNGANWQSWNSQDTPARNETSTGATDWILGAINSGNNWGWDIFGRGAFGGSFKYTPYSTVDAGSGDAQNPRYKDYPSKPRISGNPLLNSNGKIHEGSLWGGDHWNGVGNRFRDKNYDPSYGNVEGAFGGFGGGAGCQYEGGGGGGYWGGAAWKENEYSTIYNYGAQSYAHPTRASVLYSKIYGDGTGGYGDALCGLDMYCRARRARENGAPLPELHGKLYLCPTAPKATAIGEAVFHADGFNIGDTQNGIGKKTIYNWYVPEGVTSISVISIGGGGSGMGRHDGGGGGGGALAYKNNIAVTPGNLIVVEVGCGGFMRDMNITDRSPKGTDSSIIVYSGPTGGSSQRYAEAGGGYGCYASGQNCGGSTQDSDKGLGGTWNQANSDGGGDGGNGMQYSGCRQGGGGAGGYNGQGKNSSGYPSNHNYSGCGGAAGQNGGGGGGAGANSSSSYYVGGGGGTGIYGQGSNGSKGDSNQNGSPDQALDFAGRGGSENYGTGLIGYTNHYNATGNAGDGNMQADGTRGGMTGYNRWRGNYWSSVNDSNYKGPDGGFPGGGGGGAHGSDIWGMGGQGVVRIVWGAPAGFNYRSFPSSMVDISTTYDSDADVFRIGTQQQY